MMTTQAKVQYTSPESEVLDTQLEAVIAASPGGYPGMGGEETI